MFKFYYGAIWYPLDGVSSENKYKKSCAPIRGGLWWSVRRYECRSVQSAQEYIMYLDTDG